MGLKVKFPYIFTHTLKYNSLIRKESQKNSERWSRTRKGCRFFFTKWKSVKQLFNLSALSIQHYILIYIYLYIFCTFVALSCIFISHRPGSVQKRDELSHAWLFEPLRVNVINVHGYSAELQQRLLYGLRGNTRPGHFKTCTSCPPRHTHTHTL